MELTILLSKVFGLYFLIVGATLLFRRSFFRSVVNLFVEEPALRFMMGALMLFGGLFMVISHQDWSDFNTSVISLLGWLVVIKALFYLNLSNATVKRWVAWYKVGGVYGLVAALVHISLGLYLVNFSFGIF
jgi:hypothetical protein